MKNSVTDTWSNISHVIIINYAGSVNTSAPHSSHQMQSAITCLGSGHALALLGLEVPDVNDRQMRMFTTGLKRIMPHAVK